jgi:hypothetical protein
LETVVKSLVQNIKKLFKLSGRTDLSMSTGAELPTVFESTDVKAGIKESNTV